MGKESLRYGLCGAEDLFPLTPYSRYWRFYASPTMHGNAYLWLTKQAELQVRGGVGWGVHGVGAGGLDRG